MPGSSSIPWLINATLLTINTLALGGCKRGDDTDCPDEVDPIEVSGWNLGTEQYAGLEYALFLRDVVWTDLSDAEKCEAACVYAAGQPNLVLGDYDPGPYSLSATIDYCTLTLLETDGLVTGGTVSCTGEIVTTHSCGFYLGRRPLAWTDGARVSGDRQAQLDAMAATEEASIEAFLELADQLQALAAPRELIERCLAAAEEERRHVCVLVSLGAVHPDASIVRARARERSRLAIALHNATAGCVEETWAALLGRWQSQHAADEPTRDAFARLAHDEAGHAQLAWDLHAWLCDGLPPHERAEVESTRLDALRRLEQTAVAQALAVAATTREALGLPDARRAGLLAREFGGRLAACS